MRKLLTGLVAVAVLLALAAAPIMALQADSTGTAGTEAPLLSLLGLVLGSLGVAATGLLKKVAAALDHTTEKVDGWLVKLYKPAQPVIAYGLAFLLASVWGGLGIGEAPPDGSVVASSPLATLLPIVLREVVVRLRKHFT